MRKPGGATPEDIAAADRFLTKMAFRSATEPDAIETLRIDCFFFRFVTGFTAKTQYDMFQYMKTLDLTDQRAIVKLWLWLYQHDVGFQFKFQWNSELPWGYNMKKIHDICDLKERLERLTDAQIRAYDLSACQLALHQ